MSYYGIPKIDDLVEEIVEMMPPLREFFENKNSIKKYSQSISNFRAGETYIKRQKVFIDFIKKKINRIFNAREREKISVIEDPLRGLKGGVGDHHGILNDPILFGINIVTDYFRMFDREKNGDIFTFATGNVPLNDPFHRRGFMIDNLRVTLFKKEDKNKFVFKMPVQKFDFIRHLHEDHLWHHYSAKAQDILMQVQDLINKIDLSGCRMMGDQLTKINFYLWPLLFGSEIRSKVSNLISLEYDDIVINSLVYVIEHEKDSFIYQLLFNDKLREKALKHFEGRTGAWNRRRNKGSQFFWHYNDSNEQVRLKLNGQMLESEDKSFSIEWTEENIVSNLKQYKLLPCMLIKFSLLIFYMGLHPFTGYGSTYYIKTMQNELMAYLEEDFKKEVEEMKSIKVTNMTSVPVVLRKNAQGKIEDYYAFDVIKDGGLSYDYLQRINRVPLKNFLVPRLNQMYEYAFSLYAGGRPKSNIKITSEDYDQLLNDIF